MASDLWFYAFFFAWGSLCLVIYHAYLRKIILFLRNRSMYLHYHFMKYFYRALAILILLVTITLIIAGIFNRGFVEESISIEIERYGLIAVFAVFFLIEFIPQYISPYVMMALALLLG